jgi:dihydroxyacetone kinase-like protein
MSAGIRREELIRMFAAAAQQIRQEHERLSQLDCICGDGDHGTTMVRAMEEMEAVFDSTTDARLGPLLKAAGWGVLGVDGGASSAILGTFFAGMGGVELGEECDCRDLAASLDAGLRAVQKQSKATPGDKTMMDALVPAVETFAAAAAAGREAEDAMKLAADAAQAGADATKDMVGRFGRARFLGEKTRGCEDAGAVSIALLFRGFSVGLSEEKEGSYA